MGYDSLIRNFEFAARTLGKLRDLLTLYEPHWKLDLAIAKSRTILDQKIEITAFSAKWQIAAHENFVLLVTPVNK